MIKDAHIEVRATKVTPATEAVDSLHYLSTVTEAVAAKRRCHRDMRDTCIGGACMAWRWVRATVPTLNENMRGFCGLAGKPWEAAAEEKVLD